jgi:hypothetical protein
VGRAASGGLLCRLRCSTQGNGEVVHDRGASLGTDSRSAIPGCDGISAISGSAIAEASVGRGDRGEYCRESCRTSELSKPKETAEPYHQDAEIVLVGDENVPTVSRGMLFSDPSSSCLYCVPAYDAQRGPQVPSENSVGSTITQVETASRG